MVKPPHPPSHTHAYIQYMHIYMHMRINEHNTEFSRKRNYTNSSLCIAWGWCLLVATRLLRVSAGRRLRGIWRWRGIRLLRILLLIPLLLRVRRRRSHPSMIGIHDSGGRANHAWAAAIGCPIGHGDIPETPMRAHTANKNPKTHPKEDVANNNQGNIYWAPHKVMAALCPATPAI